MFSATVKKHLTFHSGHVSIGWTSWSSGQWRLLCPSCCATLPWQWHHICQQENPALPSFSTHWALKTFQDSLFGANSSATHDGIWYSGNTPLLRNLHVTCVYLQNHWGHSVQPEGDKPISFTCEKAEVPERVRRLAKSFLSFIKKNKIRI